MVPREIPSQLQGFLPKSLGMTNWVAKTANPSFPLVVGLVTQRAIQKNDSCFEIQKLI